MKQISEDSKGGEKEVWLEMWNLRSFKVECSLGCFFVCLFSSYFSDLMLVQPAALIGEWTQTNKACFTGQMSRKEPAKQEKPSDSTCSTLSKTVEECVAITLPALAEWGTWTFSHLSLPNPLLEWYQKGPLIPAEWKCNLSPCCQQKPREEAGLLDSPHSA